VRLRDATTADVPALAELVMRCDATHRSWAPRMRLPSLAEELAGWRVRLDRPSGDVVVAEDDGVLAGAAAWAPARGRHGGDTGPLHPGLGHVSAVFVDPGHWRRGIARTLLAELETRMRAAGCDRARLWTLEGSPAERLYSAAGWRRSGERGHHDPTDLPIVGYVRSLDA
jgi:GNAT superfamily N-acetyltransferase